MVNTVGKLSNAIISTKCSWGSMIVYLEILIIGWLKSSANDIFDCKPKRKFHMDMQEPYF